MFGVKWALLTMIVVLILLGTLVSPMQQSYEEMARTNARIYALEIAGIVNMLQTAPDKTTHTYNLPAMDCQLKIGKSVNFTSLENKESIIIELMSSVKVEPFDTYCNPAKTKQITFTKDRDIKVTE